MWVPGFLPRAPLVSQELQLREAQNENARLVDENSRLSGRATEKDQVATAHRCCVVWDPARALVPGKGLSPPHLKLGWSGKGAALPGEGAGGTRLSHPAPCHSPLSRWSGRMQS